MKSHVPKKSERKARNLSVLSFKVKNRVYWTQCDHEGLTQILGISAGFHRWTWLFGASECNVFRSRFWARDCRFRGYLILVSVHFIPLYQSTVPLSVLSSSKRYMWAKSCRNLETLKMARLISLTQYGSYNSVISILQKITNP